MIRIIAFVLSGFAAFPASATDLEAMNELTCSIFNTSTGTIMQLRQSGATHEDVYNTHAKAYEVEREESIGLHILRELLLNAVDEAYNEWRLREDDFGKEKVVADFVGNHSRLCKTNWYRHFLRLEAEGYTF